MVCGRFISHRNMENRRRQLRAAFCGGPLLIVFLGQEAEPTLTMKLQFSMKDVIKDTSFEGNPGLASLAKGR